MMDRYFCAVSPCFALVLGVAAADSLPWRRRARALAAVVLGSVLVLAVQQRTVLAKSELDDHAMIARVIADHASAGDGYLFGQAYSGNLYPDSVDSGRLVLASCPKPFESLVDVARYGESESLHSPVPLDAFIDLAPLDRSMRLWVIDVKDDPTPDDVPDQLAWHRWCPQEHYDVVTHTVELWTTDCV